MISLRSRLTQCLLGLVAFFWAAISLRAAVSDDAGPLAFVFRSWGTEAGLLQNTVFGSACRKVESPCSAMDSSSP